MSQCKVNGFIGPNGICAKNKPSTNECLFLGKCKHKEVLCIRCKKPVAGAILAQLRAKLGKYTHVGASCKTESEAYNWIHERSPCIWHQCEERDGYKALVDCGHGFVALTKGNILLGVGKDVIVTPSCLLVNVDVYATEKWLWF